MMRSETVQMDDEILIVDDEHEVTSHLREGWKVLIVDDEPEVHRITKMTLAQFEFDNRPIEFLHAYTGDEAVMIMAHEPDIALILLDVVMETDNAGLNVVKHVRDVLRNPYVRIVLRTGQPGQAPEDDVVANYDINDYKDKTELTSQKLRTLIRASLRSYRDIRTLEHHRRGLEKVIAASKGILPKGLWSNLARCSHWKKAACIRCATMRMSYVTAHWKPCSVIRCCWLVAKANKFRRVQSSWRRCANAKMYIAIMSWLFTAITRAIVLFFILKVHVRSVRWIPIC